MDFRRILRKQEKYFEVNNYGSVRYQKLQNIAKSGLIEKFLYLDVRKVEWLDNHNVNISLKMILKWENN